MSEIARLHAVSRLHAPTRLSNPLLPFLTISNPLLLQVEKTSHSAGGATTAETPATPSMSMSAIYSLSATATGLTTLDPSHTSASQETQVLGTVETLSMCAKVEAWYETAMAMKATAEALATTPAAAMIGAYAAPASQPECVSPSQCKKAAGAVDFVAVTRTLVTAPLEASTTPGDILRVCGRHLAGMLGHAVSLHTSKVLDGTSSDEGPHAAAALTVAHTATVDTAHEAMHVPTTCSISVSPGSMHRDCSSARSLVSVCREQPYTIMPPSVQPEFLTTCSRGSNDSLLPALTPTSQPPLSTHEQSQDPVPGFLGTNLPLEQLHSAQFHNDIRMMKELKFSVSC